MTEVITMPLSNEYFETASYGPLVAESSLPFMHSKCQDLSCHCSWLYDCIFEQRACALRSFRTLERSRFILVSRFSSVGYYYLALPWQAGAFYSGSGHWLLHLGYKVLRLQASIIIRHLWARHITVNYVTGNVEGKERKCLGRWNKSFDWVKGQAVHGVHFEFH